MTMEENTHTVVDAQIRQPRKISPFWLLPIVAFIIGALLFFQILKEQGETITIRFSKGDGILPEKPLFVTKACRLVRLSVFILSII